MCSDGRPSPRVLYLTHDINIHGGIEEVTRVMMRRFSHFCFFFSVSGRSPEWRYRLYYVLAWFRFIARLITYRPSIVHINMGMQHDFIRNIPYIALTRIAGVKLVIQTHMEVVWDLRRFPGPFRPLIRWSMSQADLCVFVSAALEKAFSVFAPKVRSTVIANTIPDRFFDQPPPDLAERRKLIVYLGRYHRQKGTDVLLEVARQHREQDPSVVYELHGYGPLSSSSDDRLLVGGWLGLAEKLHLMRTARLVVLPSREEAFGLIIPEALACGTPVVASRVGGIPDVMTDGIHGLLVEPESAGSLLEAIRTILGNDKLWLGMSRAGRERARDFREGPISARWSAVYRAITAGRSPRAASARRYSLPLKPGEQVPKVS